MEKKKILMALLLVLSPYFAFADSFIPENKVQAALLGLNMDGKSELLCYKELGLGYSSIAKI